MPHQCIRCGTFYEDGSKDIISGCGCGGRLFFFVRKERMEEIKKATFKLSNNEKKQIEEDVFDLIGADNRDQEPVILDLESIRVLKPGKYEIDIVNLFASKPVVYKVDEGKYIIDLPESFRKMFDKKK